MIYLFNSIEFIIFLLPVMMLYYIIPQKFKWVVLLGASIYFYAAFIPIYILVLFYLILVDYAAGLLIGNSEGRKRKIFLIASIISNVAVLFIFKYFDFINLNLQNLAHFLGWNYSIKALHLILPIGLSFHTFQSMSYVIDVYRGKFKAEKNIGIYSLYVMFFPQLLAGPIERPGNLLPQLKSEKKFLDINFREGFYLFIYGMFQKTIIADSLASIVDKVYAMQNPTSGQIIIATIAFAIQIYCDFAGYSNMARGVAHFLEIKLSNNFNLPYLSRTPSEFWRRWHITLSSWVRDYIYIPLGGNISKFFGLYSLFVSWFLMGLWHGAAWHFVIWGLYWFLMVAAYRFMKKFLLKLHILNHLNNKIKNLFLVLLMFMIACYGWILFRATSIEQAMKFTRLILSGINIWDLFKFDYWYLYLSILFLAIYELLQHFHNDEIFITKKKFYYQLAFYMVLLFLYVQIGAVSNVKFLYFQF